MTKQEELLNELIECEVERRKLADRAAALRVELGLNPSRPNKSHPRGGRRLSSAARKRIAAAQRARWAAYNAGKAARPNAKATPKPASLPAYPAASARKKAVWTPARRKKAAERMKRVNKEMARKRAAAKKAAA